MILQVIAGLDRWLSRQNPAYRPVSYQKSTALTSGAFLNATQAYKPGSVLTAIYLALQLLAGSSRLLETVGQTICFSTALLRDRVYSTPMFPWGGWSLTPPFHPCPKCGHFGRYLSVALVLRSPSAGVTRYPCPVEPGLSSSGGFRTPAAAVRPGRSHIVTHRRQLVKYLANSFGRGYTI